MTSETKATDKPGDPADKAADGAFGGVHSHRAGYGDDKLARLVAWLRAHPTTTLASGEGALLLAEIDRLLDDLRAQADLLDLSSNWADWAKGEMDRLRAAAKDSADHYADARNEIYRLRNELKTETETVQHLIGERTADREHWGAIYDSLDRAELILAALREPSDGVVDAVADLGDSFEHLSRFDVRTAIRAAVAAAEQEVGRE